MLNHSNTRVIINGDDFGMSPGINLAIKRLHRLGRLNSTSIMVNMPWSKEALTYARETPTLEVGVHLNLTTGEPILPAERIPSLVTSPGQFYDMSAFLSRFLAGRIQRTEIMLELGAQIERVLDHDLRPTHLDSHMHFHALPTLNAIVSELAGRYGVELERNPNISAFVVPPPGQASLVESALRKTGASLLNSTQTMMSRKSILLNGPAYRADQLVYLRWFLGDGTDVQRSFLASVDTQETRSLEVIAHPSMTDEGLPSHSNYVEGRQDEMAFLESESFDELLAKLAK